MESYRNSRRHEDDYYEQQQGRAQYQQRHPSAPHPSDRYDSRRMPSPPRTQQQHHHHQQQQHQQHQQQHHIIAGASSQVQHRQASDETNRRVSSGSTHDWADDDDGEMNFNEPLLIVSNRLGSAAFRAHVAAAKDHAHVVTRVASLNANSSATGSAIQATSSPPPLPTTTLPPKCSRSRCHAAPQPCMPRLLYAALAPRLTATFFCRPGCRI